MKTYCQSALPVAFIILLGSNFFNSLAAQNLTEIAKGLDQWMPIKMKERGIPGVQLVLFRLDAKKNVFTERSYGYSNVERKQKATKKSLFQAGRMVRPLVAYAATRVLYKQIPDLKKLLYDEQSIIKLSKDFLPIGNKQRLPTLHDWLSMTSGLAVSMEGVQLKREAATNKKGSIFFDFELPPAKRIQINPHSYVYLRKIAESAAKENFMDILKKEFRTLGLSNTCVRIQDCTRPNELSIPYTTVESHSKKKSRSTWEHHAAVKSHFFMVPELEFSFPIADSLFTTSTEYILWMSWLWTMSLKDPSSLEAQFFQKQFQYDDSLGGTAYGFFYSRPVFWDQSSGTQKENLVFYTESSLPGYSGLAFISMDGLGAVILSNKDDLHFMRQIQSRLYAEYWIMNDEKEFAAVHPISRFEESHIEGVGAYRPLSTLPRDSQWLGFLNELQLRYTSESIELSSFFEKEVVVRLYPLEKDLYLARGLVKMDGWRVRLRRNSQDEVIGLDTDLVRYERVSKFISAWSILLVMGLVVALPILVPMFYFILRRRSQ